MHTENSADTEIAENFRVSGENDRRIRVRRNR